MDDPHLLHTAINLNLGLLTCDQVRTCSMLKMIANYDFNFNYRIEGLLEASTLFKCIDIKTNLEFTLKLIPVNEFDEFIEIYLQSCDINEINRVVNIIHEKQFVFVLFESAYDDLHSYLKEKVRLTEPEIYKLFKQIVKIVHDLHEKNITLNDLKLRKFVFIDSNRKLLKLENLDGASKDEISFKNYGCVLYQAPEKLITNLTELNDTKLTNTSNDKLSKGWSLNNSKMADYWSLGIILYTLAFAKYPFHHSNLNVLKEQILNSTYSIPENNLTSNLKQLVTCLLTKNPTERIGPTEIETSDWFKLMKNNSDQTDLADHSNLMNHEFSLKSSNVINLNNDQVDFEMNSSLSNLSFKMYYSKLIKLIKQTKTSINDELKVDVILNSSCVLNVSTVYYRLNSTNRNRISSEICNHKIIQNELEKLNYYKLRTDDKN